MCADTLDQPTPSRRDVWRMFDRIARRYDLLNHLLSLNLDVAWRRCLAAHLTDRADQNVLDLATGTADQLVSMYRTGKVARGTGLDLADRMLEIGRTKVEAAGLPPALVLQHGDAEDIPFEDGTFDAVSISFGIRNVIDVPHTLGEMRRVLNPGGRALILEFSLPKNRLMRKLYLWYFRNILPRIGGLISGDRQAYRYLNETVETFPYGRAFCDLMEAAGFSDVNATPLTFGIATLYQGDK